MSTVVEQLTVDEFLSREYPRHTQLIDGVVVLNQPALLHQHVCGLFYEALAQWTRSPKGSGMATLTLNVVLESSVLAPDLLWFATPPPMDSKRAPLPPDLIVEVRSPSTWRYDVGRKRELYRELGVRELWLVDTSSRSVLVYRQDGTWERGEEDSLVSPMLPGFQARVGTLIPAT